MRSIRTTTIAFVTGVFLALIAGTFALTDYFVLENLSGIELSAAKRDARRAANAVTADVEDLERMLRDWAWWDDCYAFMADGDPEFLEANLQPRTFADIGIDLVLFLRRDRSVLWGGFAPDGASAPVEPPAELTEYLAKRVYTISGDGGAIGFSGVFCHAGEAYLIACLPVLRTSHEGPSPGWMLMARRMDPAYVSRLSLRTELDVSIALTGEAEQAAMHIGMGGPMVRQEGRELLSSMPLSDVFGVPSLIMSVRTERTIEAAGAQLSRRLMLSIALAGLAAAVLLALILERRVLSRVASLGRQVRAVRDLSAGGSGVRLSGHDELTRLAQDIATVFDELRDNETFFSQVLGAVHVGVMVVNASTRRVEQINPYGLSLMGRTEGEIIGEVCNTLVCPALVGKCPVLDLGNEVDQSKRELLRRDGSKIPILKSVVPIERKGERLLLETFIDISGQEETERLLRESEERYRTIFMNTGTASILIDNDTTIQLANSEFLKLARITEHDIDRHPSWIDFFHPEDVARMTEFHRLRRIAPTNAPRTYEARFLSAQGESVHVNMTVAMIPGTGQSIASILDISQTKAAEERLVQQAFTDVLTGLPNRQHFLIRLEHAIETASRAGRLAGVMLLDLDEFKSINDSLGHQAGDEVLIHVGKRLRGVLRRSDTLARLGGDEFTVILEGLDDPHDIAEVARKIISVLEQPFAVADAEVFVGVSIGVSLYPNDGETPERLVQCADLAMYRSKELGKNTFSFFTSDLNEQAVKRLQTEVSIRNALAEQRILAYFQPIVALDTGRIVGFEALARWQREDGQITMDAEFILVAEKSGLIMNIDRRMVSHACAFAARLGEMGRSDLRVAVNISARHFLRGNLVEEVSVAIMEYGINPAQIEIELTETAVMENFDMACKTLAALAAMGVRLALDDFGTGYSSLSYLRGLPVQKLKIDRSFTSQFDSPEGASLLRTIMDLTQSLGLTPVAEGVETTEQADFLRSIGCALAQGWLFGRPASVAETQKLVDAR